MSEDWRESPPADDYTIDELVVSVMASWFDDRDEAVSGMASFLPVCAFRLAQLTHARDLTWVVAGTGVNPLVDRIPESTLESPLWEHSVAYLDHYLDFWHMIQDERRFKKFCVGAAQLDQYGNANNSIIGGDYDRPRVRLPGNAGLGDMGSLGKDLYFWNPHHSLQSMVQRVDFVSAAGYLEGGAARSRLGLTGGPAMVVTDLAVLDFAPTSGRMRLRSLHPGVTLDQVTSATGFELVMPESGVEQTPRPTAEQVRLIREVIDPDGLRRRGFKH